MTINSLQVACTNTSGRVNYPRLPESESRNIENSCYGATSGYCISWGQLGELLQSLFVIPSASAGVVNSVFRVGSGEVIFKSWQESAKSHYHYQQHVLSKYLGAWQGDDIDEMLDMVHKTRSKF